MLFAQQTFPSIMPKDLKDAEQGLLGLLQNLILQALNQDQL